MDEQGYEAEAERRVNESKLKVSTIEAKLLEVEANCAALTTKVEGLVEEQANIENKENSICLQVFNCAIFKS
ncbi:unnamed protein product [Ilex paraguariensis]|uniref:Uncharacterized protein n=1 Tax=Ilex paraguariensis TaxID=185542 RepID=A0ABC8TQG9_9AQUA